MYNPIYGGKSGNAKMKKGTPEWSAIIYSIRGAVREGCTFLLKIKQAIQVGVRIKYSLSIQEYVQYRTDYLFLFQDDF